MGSSSHDTCQRRRTFGKGFTVSFGNQQLFLTLTDITMCWTDVAVHFGRRLSFIVSDLFILLTGKHFTITDLINVTTTVCVCLIIITVSRIIIISVCEASSLSSLLVFEAPSSSSLLVCEAESSLLVCEAGPRMPSHSLCRPQFSQQH